MQTGFVVLALLVCPLWLSNLRTENAVLVEAGCGNLFAIPTATDPFREMVSLTGIVNAGDGGYVGERPTPHVQFDRVLNGKLEDGRYVEMR